MSEVEKLEKLTLKEKPVSRPGQGTWGQKVQLRANHLKVAKFPNLKLYLYNYNVVTVKLRKTGKKVRWKVFEQIKKQNKFGNFSPIFNGNDTIYCSSKMSFEEEPFDIELPGEEGAKASNFKVTIKFTKEFSLQHLSDYLNSKQGWDGDVQTCMHALNAYLNYKVRTNFLCVGRGVYPVSEKIMLSGGVELRRGFCQSLRPGWKGLTINVDVCSGMFCPEGNVVDIVAGFLECRKDDLRRGIQEGDRRFLAKALKGMRFRVLHREKNKSIYTIQNLTKDPANKITFRDEENRETTVPKFFAKKYGRNLNFGSLPCIVVDKNSYPMEVCEILPDQPFKGEVSDEGRADMIKHTCVKPFERFKEIENSVRDIFRYDQDENLKSINMTVNPGMVKVDGRVLGNVTMTFKDQKTQEISGGRWNFVNQKIQDGKTLTFWSVLVLSGDPPNVALQFAKKLTEVLNGKGMNITQPPQVVTGNIQGNISQSLMQAAKKHKDPPQLILVIMRARSRLYGDIKRIAETSLGLRTQCVLAKNIKKQKGFDQYCANLGLKINAKLGGKNCSLLPKHIQFISSAPTMVFGADVYHSGVNELHMPSIASVTASMDQAATIYSGRYSVNKIPRNETIEQLDKMVIDLLKAFRSKNNRLPQRIIFYRDGVSEGQFRKVMQEEVAKLREAFKGGYGDNPPKLTFVIVQKRHHTRFMPINQRDQDRGNCRSGTVVDTEIVVEQEFDFFLQSHASLLGTGRPTHYRVLVDDNKFTANDFQSLTNSLCYLNARCTSAVSMVTSAYYAHLMCNRARHYTVWEGESSSGGSASCAKVNNQLTNLMYFI